MSSRQSLPETKSAAKDLPVTMVVFSESSLFLRAEKGLKEVHLPTDEEIDAAVGIYTDIDEVGFPGYNFKNGANWFKSLLQ